MAKGIDVILHPGSIDLPSLLAGLSTIVLIVVLGRTKVARKRARLLPSPYPRSWF